MSLTDVGHVLKFSLRKQEGSDRAPLENDLAVSKETSILSSLTPARRLLSILETHSHIPTWPRHTAQGRSLQCHLQCRKLVQLKCTVAKEWLNYKWHGLTMEYSIAVKMNKLALCISTWAGEF